MSGITEGSVANLDGRIRLGDQIIAVSFLRFSFYISNIFVLFYSVDI